MHPALLRKIDRERKRKLKTFLLDKINYNFEKQRTMDPCKIAFLTEALEGFTVQELQFLVGFIHAKLSRMSVAMR